MHLGYWSTGLSIALLCQPRQVDVARERLDGYSLPKREVLLFWEGAEKYGPCRHVTTDDYGTTLSKILAIVARHA